MTVHKMILSSIQQCSRERILLFIKLGIVAVIAVVASSFLGINYFMSKLNDAEVKYSLVNSNIRDLSDLTRDYLNRKIAFESADKRFQDIRTTLVRHKSLINDSVFMMVDSLWMELNRIHTLESQNQVLESQIMLLTDFVISQATSSLNLQGSPGPVERALQQRHRENAYYYMLSNYRIKSLFLTVKDRGDRKDKFITYMQSILENTEKDIYTMAKTPFEKLPRQTKDANEKILTLFTQFTATMDQIHSKQQKVFESIRIIMKSVTHSERLALTDAMSSIRVCTSLLIGSLVVSAVLLLLFPVAGMAPAASPSDLRAKNRLLDILPVAHAGEIIRDSSDVRLYSQWFHYSIERLETIVKTLDTNTSLFSEAIRAKGRAFLEDTIRAESENLQQVAKSNSTSDLIEKLTASTKEINKEIESLKNLADQTNILVLNAMVASASNKDRRITFFSRSKTASKENTADDRRDRMP